MTTTIDILGYTVKVIKGAHHNEMGVYGRFYADRLEIVVADGLSEQQEASTLIHEVIEAANYALELDMKHSQIVAMEVLFHSLMNQFGVKDEVIAEAYFGEGGDG